MDFGYLLLFLYEFSYLLSVFGVFVVIAVLKGRQAIINIIFGLYLSLLLVTFLPNYDQLFSSVSGAAANSAAQLAFFVFLTVITTIVSARVMPDEFSETRFESFFKKILLALSATLLVVAFSFQVLPVEELLSVSTPLQLLFSPEIYFFWWLLIPLIVLFFV